MRDAVVAPVQTGEEREETMQEKPVLLTQAGLAKLREELSHLVNKRRPEIAQRIKMAKEFGDLTENAEYEDAKNEQGFVEGRILTLEQMIRNASITWSLARSPTARLCISLRTSAVPTANATAASAVAQRNCGRRNALSHFAQPPAASWGA